MTRSDTEALDEVQLSLSRACEELLASDAWQRSPSESFGGLKKRLRMIPACGLPRMRVVANATLEKLGRIPRSHEGYQVDALEAVERLGGTFIENRPNAVILFYSHRWSRPNWCEALGKDLPCVARVRRGHGPHGHTPRHHDRVRRGWCVRGHVRWRPGLGLCGSV